MRFLKATWLAAAVLAACATTTAEDLSGTFVGSPKVILTVLGGIREVPPSGDTITLTADGTGTLVATIWSDTCPLKFTNGSDPMKFQLQPTNCIDAGIDAPSS